MIVRADCKNEKDSLFYYLYYRDYFGIYIADFQHAANT